MALGSRKMRGGDEGWTGSEKRQKNELMRQFLRVDGPKGATKAFQEGWDRTFAAKSADPVAEEKGPKSADPSADVGHILLSHAGQIDATDPDCVNYHCYGCGFDGLYSPETRVYHESGECL